MDITGWTGGVIKTVSYLDQVLAVVAVPLIDTLRTVPLLNIPHIPACFHPMQYRATEEFHVKDEVIQGELLAVNIEGTEHEFELFEVIEFDSKRKRMSVIVRDPRDGGCSIRDVRVFSPFFSARVCTAQTPMKIEKAISQIEVVLAFPCASFCLFFYL